MKADKKFIWDYDTKTLDLKNPMTLCWYLSRKVNFGDFKAIDSALLEKNLSKLDIDPTLKTMIKRYYAGKRAKNRA